MPEAEPVRVLFVCLGNICRSPTAEAVLRAMDRANYETLGRMATPGCRDRVRLFMEFAADSGHDEVPDPYYGGPAGFETVLDLAEAASRGLLRAVRSRAVRRL